jgi:hypothetical protein
MLLMVVQRARAIAQNVFFGEIEPGAGEAAFLFHHLLQPLFIPGCRFVLPPDDVQIPFSSQREEKIYRQQFY